MAKLLDDALGNYEYVMLLLVLIVVVWLLVRDLGLSASVNKQGFYTAGAGLRFYGQQTQPNAPNYNQYSGNVERMGTGANEQPVFWNPGSFSLIDGSQQASVMNSETNNQVPVSSGDQEGMKPRAAYVQGMSVPQKGHVGPAGVNLDDALIGK